MDFTLPPKVEDLRRRVSAFMDQHVYPADSLDMTQRQIYTVGVGAYELVGRVRFQTVITEIAQVRVSCRCVAALARFNG